MIAVDTNVLVYAHRSEMPLHAAAMGRLRELVEGSVPWALPVFCIGEFVRVVTHARIFYPPSDLDPALEFIAQVLAGPSARLLVPGPTFATLFAEACRLGGARVISHSRRRSSPCVANTESPPSSRKIVTSLALTSSLQSASSHLDRDQERVRLFDSVTTFRKRGGPAG